MVKIVPEGAESISDEEKVRIVSHFIYHSPPGEFNEVLSDVKGLTNNNILLKEGVSKALSKYSKDQMIPVKIENSVYPVLITEHNDLGGSRFFDARSKKSFKYDHIRIEASEYQPWESESETESLRSLIEKELDSYVLKHYATGSSSVFAKQEADAIVIIACIEAHHFQPRNYFNGRWRSRWTMTVKNRKVGIKGNLQIHVHYYEDGNVQLVSSKHIDEDQLESSSEEKIAVELIKHIEDEEDTYQKAIYESYQTMSDTTFKALRRQLPVTRTKIDWNKIMSYNISKELKNH